MNGAIKVKNNDGIVGLVSVESWSNPYIWLMDFQVSDNGEDKNGEKVFAGDFWPEEREQLEYLGIEEF